MNNQGTSLNGARSFILSDGNEIHNELKQTLAKAEDSIKVAMAWFTDQELFDILLSKSEKGIRVILVIADNEENQRLDFDQLQSLGAKVIRVKGSGFGILHQKYCIVDDSYAVMGSYNWTNNARKNNSETALFTTEKEHIMQLESNFNSLTTNESDNQTAKPVRKIETREGQIEIREKDEKDFIDYLDRLTRDLVDDFDQNQIEEIGYLSARDSTANTEVLKNDLDVLLHDYRRTVDTNQNQIRSYRNLLETAWNKRESELKAQKESENRTRLSLHDFEKRTIEQKQENLRSEVRDLQREEMNLKNKEENLENKIEEIKSEIEKNRSELVLGRFDFKNTWYFFAIAALFFLYLFIFYSSAAYTLQFAYDNAMHTLRTGGMISTVDFFDPGAIWKIMEKGAGEVLFAFLVVLIPTALAMIGLFTDNKFLKVFLGWIFAVLVVDFFVAAVITKTIHEVGLLAGRTAGDWRLLQAIQDLNFWKVFIFGAVPLVIFKLVGEKLQTMYRASSASYVDKERDSKIRNLKEAIETKTHELQDISLELSHLGTDIKTLADKINELEDFKLRNDHFLERDQEEIGRKYDEKIVLNKRIYDVYNSNIDTATSRLAEGAVRARVTALRRGWNRFMTGYFSEGQMNLRNEHLDAIQKDWFEEHLSLV